MTMKDWFERGRADAEAGKPFTPPPLGPIAQQYTLGYEGASS